MKIFACLIGICARLTAQTNLPDNIVTTDCVAEPLEQQWGIVQGNSSPSLSHMYAQPFIGDIDNDGQSEIVTVGYYDSPGRSSSIIIYGQNLQLKYTINTDQMYVYGGYPVAVADVDRDGLAEIFVQNTDGFLRCYHPDGSLLWTSNVPLTATQDQSPSLMLADVNGDSIPEIWSMRKIFNAISGVELATIPEILGYSLLYVGSGGNAIMPVFADFDNDGILEFAGGNKVYKLNITNSSGTAGNSVTLWKSITANGIGDGLTSVADIDLDGYLDVVVVRNGCMYAWKPYSGAGSSSELIASCPYSSTTAGSRALLTDVDNDGYPEILFTYAANVTAYKYVPTTQSLQQMWLKSTSDLSGATTMTAFDFNQDGSVEIVYRDQSDMRIIDGVTGNNKSSFACVAPTASEYPAIVDLDRDGQADIVASSSTYDLNHDKHAKLIVFHSPANAVWAPARYVWNQHAYNSVNVNNDLTIPANNFNPATPFTDPDGVVRRPFNNFLQQATTLDQYGRPFLPLANATAVPGYITYEDSVYTLTYQLCNTGGQTLFPPIPCSFYAEEYGGAYLGMSVYNNVVEPGDCVTCTMTFTEDFLSVHSAYPEVDSIVLVVNANQQGIAQNGGLQMECDTTDNTIVIPFVICPRNTVTADICEGEPYFDENFDIPLSETGEAGTFYYSRVFEEEDCDSVVVLVLRVHPEYDMQFTETILSGMSYDNHGIYLSASMLDGENRVDTTVTYQSVYGCDSVVRVTIQIENGNSLPDNMVTADCTTDAVEQPWDAQVLSSVNDIHCYYVPIVGDIDGDGIVEIVAGKALTNDHYTTQVGIYRGVDLQQIGTINVSQRIYAGFAGPVAIVRYPDGSGGMQGAIILHCYDNKLRSYDIHGNLLATSDVNTPCEGVVSITDFNYDGWPEVYIGNVIYDAATLKRLCAGPANGNMGRSWRNDVSEVGRSAMPFAANVLGDSIPELICGNTIYNVDISSRTDLSLNHVTELKTINIPTRIPQDGNVAVVDFNKDGQLDVMVVIDKSGSNIYDTAYIYAYDPVTEDIFFIHSHYARTIGFPLVGDIDGDLDLDMVYIDYQNPVSNARITAITYSPTLGLQSKWQATHADESGQTSMTLFDFNQDGISEIVYRDMANLRIINGSGKSHLTGNDTISFYNLYTKNMYAGTWKEYPVVADVNGDGAAEIVVCGKVGNGLGWVGGQLWVIGGIHPWAPARPVWNQYMYNVTNINKDLTVPVPLFDNATAFTDPQGVTRRPFNNFLQQATTLDQYGRPFMPLANLSITGEPAIEFVGDAISVEMEVCNTGELTLLPPMYVAVYTASDELVQTEAFAQELLPNECVTISLSISQEMIKQFDNPYPLRIAVNDNGEGTAQYGGLQAECDTADNFAYIDGRPCQMTVPNVITPNGDGINDVFEPQLEGEFVSMEMEIFDRWGKRVYRQESKEALKWDALGVSDGVYFCAIEFRCAISAKKYQRMNTSVTVVR